MVFPIQINDYIMACLTKLSEDLDLFLLFQRLHTLPALCSLFLTIMIILYLEQYYSRIQVQGNKHILRTILFVR